MNDSLDAQTIRIKPYYIFSAISLALVILLLAILFPRESIYVAEAQLSIKPAPGGEKIAPAELQAIVRDLLADAQQVERAVAGLTPELNASLGGSGESVDMLGAFVTRQLDLQLNGESSQQPQLTIRFGNPVRATAVNVVTALAQHFATSFHQRVEADGAAANVPVAELKKRIADVRQRRQQFVEQQVALRQQSTHRRGLVNEGRPSVDRGQSAEAASGSEAAPRQVQDLTPEPGADSALAALSDVANSTKTPADLPTESPKPVELPLTPSSGQDASFGKTAAPLHAQPGLVVSAGRSAGSESPQHFDLANAPAGDVETQGDVGNARKDNSVLAEPAGPHASDNSPSWQSPDSSWGISPPPELGKHAISTEASLTPPTGSIEQERRAPQLVEPNPEWSEVSEQIASLRVELREMLRIYTPKHPLAEDILKRIEDLERTLQNTPQFIEIPSHHPASGAGSTGLEPTPSFGPVPAPASRLDEPISSDAAPEAHDQLRAQWVEEAVQSVEYQKLTAELEQLQSELALAIQQRQRQSVALRGMSVEVCGEPQTTLARTGSLSILDVLTYLLPACVVGLAASVIRSPNQPPLELYSLADVGNAMGLPIVGAISTTDGPEIHTPEGGGPPNSILRLVFASEVLLVATAAVLLISCFQIPDFATQLVRNPISALVMSIDYSLDFIRGFF